jgi:hypothetical protein
MNQPAAGFITAYFQLLALVPAKNTYGFKWVLFFPVSAA